MKSKTKSARQQYLLISLLICGGPIGKGNGKSIIQSEASEPSNKKTIKTNGDNDKKVVFANKSK